MNNKISIIIPLYNSEKFLRKNLDSIFSQTYKNYELILINDGSTDGSLEVCKNYQKKHKNIIIKSQKNKGVSSARNEGLKIASGEYVMFLDADDFLLDNYCVSKIIKELNEKKIDVLLYKMKYYYDNKKKYIKLPNYNVDENNIIDDLISQNKLSISPCDKVVKRSILIDNNIFFDENMKNLEDADWSLRIYNSTSRIKCINEELYVYRQHCNTASRTYSKTLVESYKFFFKKWENFNTFKFLETRQILDYLSYQYTIFVAILRKANFYKSERNWVKRQKFLLNFGSCKKVKVVNFLTKLFGIDLVSIFLECYLSFRNSGEIRL